MVRFVLLSGAMLRILLLCATLVGATACSGATAPLSTATDDGGDSDSGDAAAEGGDDSSSEAATDVANSSPTLPPGIVVAFRAADGGAP